MIREMIFRFSLSGCPTCLVTFRNRFFTLISTLVDEFLRIGRSTLRFEDFVPKAKELFDRMLTQGAKASVSRKMILKIMSKHPEDLVQFKTEHNEILKSVTNV